mmetsp:Transcript_15275/g.25838  ORF Transcript_15275/g.25838 Transcript_15275/m.25838 type:complete len:123 (+) Transcript_15275:1692-2060(+)
MGQLNDQIVALGEEKTNLNNLVQFLSSENNQMDKKLRDTDNQLKNSEYLMSSKWDDNDEIAKLREEIEDLNSVIEKKQVEEKRIQLANHNLCEQVDSLQASIKEREKQFEIDLALFKSQAKI